MNIRLVCISDTHGSHRKVMLPPGDVLIHCGDLMLSGRVADEIWDFNQWMGEQPFTHRIAVAGNHDILFERQASFARSLVTNFKYLENSGTIVCGLKVWGSPQQPEFMDWAFNVPRGEKIRRYWDMIPSDTDVLITHGPPKLILDQCTPGSEHLGCEELSHAVARVRPRLHLFGHIHGGHGHYWNGTTDSFNCAVMDEAYQVKNPVTVIDLPVEHGFEHLPAKEWR